MFRSGRKFSAVATALIVLVAHVLCVCRTAGAFAAAAAPVPEAADPHACCKHESPDKLPAEPDHSKDHDGQCQHCAGFQAPAIKPDVHRLGDSPFLHAAILSFDSPPAIAGYSFAAPGQFDRPSNVSPPTLLRLCCALNL